MNSPVRFLLSLQPRNLQPNGVPKVVLILLMAIFGIVHISAQEAVTSSDANVEARLPDAPSASKPSSSAAFGETVGRAAKTVAQDEVRIIGAPFQKKALVLDAIALGATGALIATDETVAQQVPVSWHQSGLHISDGCTYGTAAVAGGILITGLATHDEHAQRTGLLSAEATVDTLLLTGAMKLVFSRERPYTNNSEGNFFAGNFSSGSFPSGHSAVAWTLATVVAKEYPKTPVQLAMYGLAATVSLTRVTAGEHFPSDVVVGSTVGYLIGVFVTNKDKHAYQGPAHTKSRIRQVPNAVIEHVSFR
ncbi:phosphoesterase, PA-phosphatase related protein [Candidatus Koribacter versatilis Ellin345]|uniref:Phosphoesterase, PA-phosphatase related protein n=1 Tax=Koribacter versatilis (strain Ellin345) TaxID=204669 RepID=Q1IUY2_KORVE|nr:phosphatase PAP2 family protein [Candidatus Koribacter versatilis]ABF39318.1 phosphoesterase, PA-phosphatase related protein [Candidatus Koribacter versatilis Ellin345]